MPEVSMTLVKEAGRARVPSSLRVLMWLPEGGQWVEEAALEQRLWGYSESRSGNVMLRGTHAAERSCIRPTNVQTRI